MLKKLYSQIRIIECKKQEEIATPAHMRPFYAAHITKSAIDSMKRNNCWRNVPARFDYRVTFRVLNENVISFKNDSIQNCLVPQCFIEDALRSRCFTLPNIEIEFETEFVSFENCSKQSNFNRVVKTKHKNSAKNMETPTHYVFGCDGPQSSVRRHMQYAFGGATRARWVVTDVYCKGSFNLIILVLFFI